MKKLLLLGAIALPLFANNCDETLLDIKINKDNVRLSSVINGIAKDCGYSVFYENQGNAIREDMVGLISLEKKTPKEIIDFLLSQYNYNYQLEDKVLTISKYSTKTFKIDYIDTKRSGSSNTDVSIAGGVGDSGSSQGSSGNNGGATIDTIEEFDFWSKIEEEVNSILIRPEDDSEQKAQSIINPKGGFVTVTGTNRQLMRVDNYLEDLLDTLRRQVMIDVKVISVTLDDSHKTGIDWSKLSISFNSSGADTESKASGGAPTQVGVASAAAATIPSPNSWVVSQSYFDANAFFSFLRGHGETRSLSNPKVLAMNAQPTIISIGDNVNYLKRTSNATEGTTSETTEAKEIFIGVLLDITPKIDDNGYITLRINPSISEFKYTEDAQKQTTSRQLPPDTVSRRISTIVRVRDSDVIVLGGLISSSKNNFENKVPLLGDIPFLGRLFKSNEVTDITTELVFVLTPRIITHDSRPTLKELGFQMSEDEL